MNNAVHESTVMDLDTLQRLRQPTEFLDYRSPEVQTFVERAVPDRTAPRLDQVRQLYYAVRDGVDYEVYGADLSRTGLRASSIVAANRGFCVHKSILFAATARTLGVPSRLVVSEVRNHLASERLRALVGGEVFVHWLTALYLEGRWVKATPVFNKLLCRLYRMTPLEFDPTRDGLHQPFDEHAGEHMEFLHHHGEFDFDDLAYDRLMAIMADRHPAMFADGTTVPGGGSLADEAPTRRPDQH